MKVTSLAEVREHLDVANKGTWDTLLEPQEMTLLQGRLVSPRLYRYEYPQGLAPTTWATGQLCQFLGIPSAYFRRCPTPLQDTQANFWLQHLEQEQARQEKQAREKAKNGKAERWLLRARGETLRGILTERYTRLDHLELYEAVAPALAGSSEYAVDWFALSDESLHLRLHDTRLHRDALPGDRLLAGVHIANSEVGKRAVTVDALVYRLVCTNGLIRKVKGASLLHQRHIALSRPEFARTVQQAVRDAFAQSGAYLDRLAAAVAHPIPDVERVVHKIALDWGLTQATEEAVKAAILLERSSQHETLFGLINGLTSAARSLGADERYVLESQAGHLLETYTSNIGTGTGKVLDTTLLLPSPTVSTVERGRREMSGPIASIASVASNGEAYQDQTHDRVGLFAL